MTFADRCVHCEHYHEGGTCCYCKKEFTNLTKTREEHLAELGDLDGEGSIDI